MHTNIIALKRVRDDA